MHSISIPAGSTSKSVYVEIFSLTTGLRETGLTYDWMTILWTRPGQAAAYAVAAELATETTAWTSAGFREAFAGVYRVDVPNAALASGVDRVTMHVVDSLGSPTIVGTVNIELTNVTTDFAGSAVRRVAAR